MRHFFGEMPSSFLAASYNTLLVVNELIKASKDFDLLILPNARHGYGKDNGYVIRRRWDFFVRHLLQAEPPANFDFRF